jgi:hypothetical protein
MTQSEVLGHSLSDAENAYLMADNPEDRYRAERELEQARIAWERFHLGEDER